MPAKPLELVAKGKDQGATALIDKIIAKSKQLGLAQAEMEGATTAATRKATVERQVMYERMFKTVDAEAQRAEQKRIALQRSSIAVEESLQKKHGQEVLRQEYEIRRAQASALSNLHERQRAMENAQYVYKKAQLIGNNEALELLEEQHATKMIAIARRQAEYASQPFQKLLAELATLTGLGGFKARAAEGVATMTEHGFMARGEHPAAGMTMLAGTGSVQAQTAAVAALTAETEAGAVAQGKFNAMGLLMSPWVIGGTIALTGLAVALHHAAEKGEELRKEEEQFRVSFDLSGRSAEGLRERLEKSAEALSHVTNASEGTAKAALGILLPLKNIADGELPKLLKLSEDVAEKFGMTVPEAAEKLGKAFEVGAKGAKGLSAAHVYLSTAETEMMKQWEREGNLGAEHAFLFKKLSAAVGGYAEATAHSATIIGNEWDHMWGKIGLRVKQVEDALAGWILKTRAANQEESAREGDYAAAQLAAQKAGYKRGTQARTDYINATLDQMAKARKAAAEGINPKQDGEDAAYLKRQGALMKALADSLEKPKKVKDDGAFKRMADLDASMLAEKTRYFSEQEKTLDGFHRRQAEAEASFDTQQTGRMLAKNDARRAAELEDFDRAQKLLADLDNIDLSSGAAYAKYQEERTALVAAQSAERENDVRHEAEVQLEVDKKIVAANRQIANSYLTIAGVFAEAFNVGPLQEALQWLQRIETVLQAIQTIKEATTALGLLAAPVNPIAALLGFESGGPVLPKFAPGGPVYGARHSNGGVPIEVEGGENVWSRNDVSRAGGQRGVEAMKQGGGGFTHSGPVIVQVAVPGGASREQAAEIGRAISVGYLESMKAFNKQGRNTDYYRARGG